MPSIAHLHKCICCHNHCWADYGGCWGPHESEFWTTHLTYWYHTLCQRGGDPSVPPLLPVSPNPQPQCSLNQIAKTSQGWVSPPLPIRCSSKSPSLTYNQAGPYFCLNHPTAKLDWEKMQLRLEIIQHQPLHNISVAEQNQHFRTRDSHWNTWKLWR